MHHEYYFYKNSKPRNSYFYKNSKLRNSYFYKNSELRNNYFYKNSELRNRFYSKKHSKLGSILFWNKYIDIVLNTNFSVDEKLILVKFLNIICFIINIHHINRDYKLANIKRLYCEYVAILQTESMYKLDLLKINKKVKLDFNQIVNYALPL